MGSKGPLVIVVGAGASKDFGDAFPLGWQLAQQIEACLNEEFGQPRDVPNGIIAQTLRRTDVDFGTAVSAANRIRRGLSAQNSIDDYLNEWQDEPVMSLIAKLAIALCIIRAERRSSIAGNNMEEESIRRAVSASMKSTWLGHLLQNIKSTVHKRKAQDILSDVGFIVFNYDRCIEHFLFWAIRNMADFDESAALQALAKVPIIHPYGCLGGVGATAGENLHGPFLGFGALEDNVRLLSRGIRTYTEEQTDPEKMKQIANLLSAAQDVVFLGFSYHPQNMKLLFGDSSSENRNYWGACVDQDPGRVRRTINQLMIAGAGAEKRLTDLPCLDFVKRHTQMLVRD